MKMADKHCGIGHGGFFRAFVLSCFRDSLIFGQALCGGLFLLAISVAAALRVEGEPGGAGGRQAAPGGQVRRPVALALADDGRLLFVGNERSGSISAIDTESLQVVGEAAVCRRLADFALSPDGTKCLAVDEASGELVVLARKGAQLKKTASLQVAPGPVSIQITPDGTQCSIASLWARCLTLVDLKGPSPRITKTVALDFPPRVQLALPKQAKLVVASAFAGRLAVVDLASGYLDSSRALPGHNLRGLALSGDGNRLLASHQVLHSLATTSSDDIHWGNLLTNCVRDLALPAVLDPKADLLRDSRLLQMGDPGRGAGDPAGLAVLPNDMFVLALAGVGEVAIVSPKESWRRITVGTRPTAIAVGPGGNRIYVANTHADTIAVVGLRNALAAEIPLGPKAETTKADRGEVLFYNARLSQEGWFSCHSCHTDGHTPGLLADTLGDGTYGTPKRILSLLGVKDTGPWAWNGSKKELGSQIRSSMATTMRAVQLGSVQEEELLAYLETLVPPPPRGRFAQQDEKTMARGRELFERQGCSKCHTPPLYTSARIYNVGLDDDSGKLAFNPPSLRGVSQAGPYFHDGRAESLSDVLVRFRHQLKAPLSSAELEDLLTFLNGI
jgi:DNA-binding beta-propeller fold protein YncE